MTAPSDDARFMAIALALGARGLGRTWPNPAVGCVIVNDGRIVGRGWTRPGGRPHAEPVALAMAGDRARGATVYVSLEPCSHHGKSPPCADALIASGVKRVVAALEDPYPSVSGAGIARLRAAGIDVTVGICAREAEDCHRGFLMRVLQGRPMLTLKLAASFDARIATASGESRWITGSEARRQVHMERARHDAVLIGGGTARADDPALTVRELGISHQPVRVVVSSALDLPRAGQLWNTARGIPLWLIHGPAAPAERRAAWEAGGARCIEVEPGPDGHPLPQRVMRALGDAGLTRVYCEGGGALAASLLRADMVDELIGFSAGLLLGADARPAIGPLGIGVLTSAPRFDLVESRRLGADLMHRWRRAGR